MPRKNHKGRRQSQSILNKFRIARLLGIKPQNLTSVKGYVKYQSRSKYIKYDAANENEN